ncbi:MAG: beta-hexosaminidase [Firmicutes bacterium]|nr:beta-hexosaminidase [[Eubacterium] siraeum]MCM1488101.1 beta-hexosaminidase [Bacillota bacterium]
MKNFKKNLVLVITSLCLILSGCAHGEDAPVDRPTENTPVVVPEENTSEKTAAVSEKTDASRQETASDTASETVSQTFSETADETVSEKAEVTAAPVSQTAAESQKPQTTAAETAAAVQTEKAPAPSDGIWDVISNMSLEEKVGQIILVRYSAETAAKASQYHFGGYTLYAADFADETPESIQAKLAKIKSNSVIPPFFAADEEGGQVIRISKYAAFSDAPLPAIGSSAAKSDIKGFAEKMAQILKKGGVNLNLAPVADVAESEEDYIYGRTCMADYDETGEIIGALVTELNSRNVVSCLKHFPGYGSNVDTHTGIAVDNRTAESFESKDFIPFKAGIRANVPMIMVNHNIVTAYNDKVPASLAPEVHSTLRALGFNGVIVTDDLGMGAILQYSDSPYADAVLAGNDLLCTSDGEACYKAVYDAAKSGVISEERLDESVYRILSLKKRYGILS